MGIRVLRVGLAVVGAVDKFLGGLEVTVGCERLRGGAGSLFGATIAFRTVGGHSI